MMVVTPGLDLKPLTAGSDTVFVLDASGSMQTKLSTLAEGVSQALGKLRPEDRFRVVAFNQRATELVPLVPATPDNVQRAIAAVRGLKADRSTNLFAGVREGLSTLDADRATSLVLVTDGVANEGVVNPADFHRLLRQHDLRLFGFLMGNSANWPLMRTMADATGGFYAGVSNDDDIVGQLLLAKSKLTHESLHDASFHFTGVRVFDTTGDVPQKIHRGEQLVIFGRYDKPGPATVTLTARLTGEDRTYRTTFDFPETDTANPEIERLWALALIEQAEVREATGALPPEEARSLIRDLGVTYQLVTDHTTMVVLDDATFAKHGVARENERRTGLERRAQALRAGQPVASHRVDAGQPMFSAPAPHVSQGGGALDPFTVNLMLLALIVGGSAYVRGRFRRTDR
jgi:Ca-activated chloride channel family protein